MTKKAFTLIELLVVIAIIALLLAVLLPALQTAKEQAKQVYCKNNLKQMAQAAYVYTADHDDYFPIAHYTKTVEPVSATASVLVIDPPQPKPDKRTISYAWDFTRVSSGGRTENIPGILWQGDTTEQVQQCPSYKGGDNWSGSIFTGYNYNTSYIGHGQMESVSYDYPGEVSVSSGNISEKIVLPAKVHHVRNMAGCILFGDGHYAGGANKLMRSPLTWKGDVDWSLRLGGTQGFRHNGQTNTAWADGHVASQKNCYTETHSKYKPQLDAYNAVNKVKIGFISPDNSLYDLK